MSTWTSFEDLEAWQLSRKLVWAVYRCSGTGKFEKDYALRDQIRRAAISVMSNIAEGFERGGNAEFLQFLAIAKGSLAEVESQLVIAGDLGYATENEITELREMAAHGRRLVGGLMRYLSGTKLKGQKVRWRQGPEPRT